MSAARRRLLALLGLSCGLRIWLALGGGQMFWPDEGRYRQSQAAAVDLVHGRGRAALEELFGHPEHTLFRPVGLPIALVEQALGLRPALVGCYFGLFSVLAIYLVWAVARRAGAEESEALWAAFLAACANSLFFYSSHYFPYDASLCCMLGALWRALGDYSPRNSLLTGVCAGLGFLTYNGYWLLGGAVLIVHVLLGEGGGRKAPWRAGWSAVGLVLPVAAVAAAGWWATGRSWIAASREFSTTVTQGDFGQGYRVIGNYLWAAEGGSLILWALGVVVAVAGWSRAKRRLAWHLGGAALVVGGLWVLSDVFPRFVVYGRLVRCVVPFLCLGAACGIDGLARRRGRGSAVAIAAAAAGLAAFNFSGPLRQWFPREFRAAAACRAEQLSRREPGNYRVMNATFLFTPDEVPRPPLPATTVWRVRHPEQYPPFLFEGFTADLREEFLRRDCSMQLVRLGAAGNVGWLGARPELARLSGYPGRVALRLRFNRDASGRSEPLIVTGETERGDLLYVVYQDAAHLRFGFDHWGIGGTVSPSLPVAWDRDHELVASLGSMYPANFAGMGRGRLLLTFDGKTVFDQPQDFYPSDPGAVLFGLNLIGGGTALDRFSGAIESVTPAQP